jgi:hypothetical protein
MIPSHKAPVNKFVLSLFSKQRNAGKSRLIQLTLFNYVRKHIFGGLGADTLTSCESNPFVSVSRISWGCGGGGGDTDNVNKD